MGKAYGSYGDGLPIAVSLVAILMGLNLLQVSCCSYWAAGLLGCHGWQRPAACLRPACARHIKHLLCQCS